MESGVNCCESGCLRRNLAQASCLLYPSGLPLTYKGFIVVKGEGAVAVYFPFSCFILSAWRRESSLAVSAACFTFRSASCVWPILRWA